MSNTIKMEETINESDNQETSFDGLDDTLDFLNSTPEEINDFLNNC